MNPSTDPGSVWHHLVIPFHPLEDGLPVSLPLSAPTPLPVVPVPLVPPRLVAMPGAPVPAPLLPTLGQLVPFPAQHPHASSLPPFLLS